MNPSEDPKRAIRKLNQIGLVAVVLLVGGIGGWAATSKLSGAVIAPGTIVVESNVKKVQHPTGGIVGEILVKEGGSVEAGQVVMRLDDTVTRATLNIVQSQLNELKAREARLRAERDSADTVTFPDDLVAAARNKAAITVAGERKLFKSRRATRNGQKAQLRERISQNTEEIRGLSAQLVAKKSEIKFIEQELVGVADLYKKKLTPIVRFMQLQRDKAKLEGERGQHISAIAKAKVKIGETKLQIIQIDQDFRTEVLKELRETQGKIAELKERYVAAEDQLKRIDIRAPQSGIVYQLAVHTVGGVIGGGDAVMQIVPRSDALVVEAKVSPQDIDQLAVGAKVSVRMMAANQRVTPNISGTLTRISADLTRDNQTRQTYYVVRVALYEKEVARLGQLKLMPGMPAEVFIETYDRTPLQYLLKPLREQIARTFRER